MSENLNHPIPAAKVQNSRKTGEQEEICVIGFRILHEKNMHF